MTQSKGVDLRYLHSSSVAAEPEAVLAVRPEGQIVLFNPAAERLFGLAGADVLGMPVEVLAPAASLDDLVPLAWALRASPPLTGRRRLSARSGDGVTFAVLADLGEAVVEGQDVRVATLCAGGLLRPGWFDAVAAAVGHPLMVVQSADWKALYVNEAGRKALAPHGERELVGRSAYDLVFRDPSVERAVLEALKQGRGRVKDLLLKVEPEGIAPSWLKVSFEPFDDSGVPCYMMSWSDMTATVQADAELARSREAAETAAQAKSEFLARMSHELRTPLNAIIGFAEMLYEQIFGPLGSDKYTEYARDIQDSGRHLLSLINDLLDMAKIEVGKYELNRRMLDISGVVESARRLMQKAADEKQVTIVTQVPIGMPRIYGDERALRQVVHNLLSNAVKFSPQGGRVVVEADVDNAATVLSLKVSDSGAGIPPEDIERILRPFERGRSPAHPDDSSVGLGLPLAKYLVEMHGGTLWLESGRGTGTTAQLRMPRVPVSN